MNQIEIKLMVTCDNVMTRPKIPPSPKPYEKPKKQRATQLTRQKSKRPERINKKKILFVNMFRNIKNRIAFDLIVYWIIGKQQRDNDNYRKIMEMSPLKIRSLQLDPHQIICINFHSSFKFT